MAFTLYRIVKRSVAENVPNMASVHTGNPAFEAVSALEQNCSAPLLKVERSIQATSHLTIFMRDLRAKSEMQRNNYHHGNGVPSLTSKTSSVSLIFTHGTHRNVTKR